MSPPAKKRRTSETQRQLSPPATDLPPADTLNGKGTGKAPNPLDGFDDSLSDSAPNETPAQVELFNGPFDDDETPHCAICLSPIVNKAVITPCLHSEFCFACIRPWTDQSRRCPLCLGNIHQLLHSIRSDKDFLTLHLLPLSITAGASSSTAPFPQPTAAARPAYTSLPRHAFYGRRQETDSWRETLEERALERRRYIYREKLFAKHVASNRYTGFKPISASQFATNANLKARVIKFIRRELQVFPHVDVSFLTTYLLSIASQLDLRSASAIRLIADFLVEDQAEHLVHEIVTFASSPFNSLDGYDRMIQYGRPARAEEPVTVAVSGPPPVKQRPRPPPTGPSLGQVPRRQQSYRGAGFEMSGRGPPRDDQRRMSRNGGRPDDRWAPVQQPRQSSGYDGFAREQRRPSSRSRSRSRSVSRSQTRSPKPTNHRGTEDPNEQSDAISIPSPPASPRPETPPPAPFTFSIFGAARRKTVPPPTPPSASASASSPSIHSPEAIPFPSTSSDPLPSARRDDMATAAETRRAAELHHSRLQHASSPSSSSLPTDHPRPSTAPTTDLRSLLQSRLTSEYRNLAAASSLRERLHSRLRREKKEVRLLVEVQRDDHDEGGYWEGGEGNGAGGGAAAYTFTDETRSLLLARLEEEKARMAEAMREEEKHLEEEGEGFGREEPRGAGEEMQRTASDEMAAQVVVEEEPVVPALSKEEELRAALARRRAANASVNGGGGKDKDKADLEARSKELREKLKERLNLEKSRLV